MVKEKQKQFTVAVAYTGECCTTPHILIDTVFAVSEDKALDLINKRLERKGFFPGDSLATQKYLKQPGRAPYKFREGS
jgi:hypothetical protein